MEDSDLNQNRKGPQPGGSGRDSGRHSGRDRGPSSGYSGGTERGSGEGSVRFILINPVSIVSFMYLLLL